MPWFFSDEDVIHLCQHRTLFAPINKLAHNIFVPLHDHADAAIWFVPYAALEAKGQGLVFGRGAVPDALDLAGDMEMIRFHHL